MEGGELFIRLFHVFLPAILVVFAVAILLAFRTKDHPEDSDRVRTRDASLRCGTLDGDAGYVAGLGTSEFSCGSSDSGGSGGDGGGD